MNYETDIVIDEQSLDIEWLEQPRLMLKYARHASEAKKKLDQAKEKLDLVKSELDREIRMNPDEFDLAKVTDSAVSATIPTCAKYKDASEAFIQAKFEADIAMNAVYAFNARKDALENLVKLYGQQYFAGPKMPRDITWERQAHAEKVNAGVASKLKRTRTE